MGGRRQLEPRKQPVQERSRQTVDVILEAAAQVFDQRGYDDTTTDRIAARAGVSVGSLYQYFPGKDAILVALVEQHERQGVGLVRQLIEGAGEGLTTVPLEQLLTLFAGAILDLHQDRPRLHRMLFMETPLPPEHNAALSSMEDALAAEIRVLLQRHPDVQTADLDLSIWMMLHLTQGLVHDYVCHPPRPAVSRERGSVPGGGVSPQAG